MDKRKANGAETPDNDDRAMKRRKLAEEFDLSKGETRESTTAYGMSFLDQIRRTSDKNGRRVAGYFEELPAKANNQEYYKRTRMPISLSMVETKLQNGEFKNLSELESYLKRMIQNAKEFYPRSSSTFDDAERVRKAVSNYMTKTNPAYQKRGYQAVPTPLPPEGDEAEAEEEDGEDEAKAEEADEAEEAEEEKEAPAEEEEAVNGHADTGRSSRKRSIILKRKGSSRSKPPPSNTPRRASARFDRSQVQAKVEKKPEPEPEPEPEEEEEEEEEEEAAEEAEEAAEEAAEEDAEEDAEPEPEPEEDEDEGSTESASYEGLTFQQAQEKVIEDLLNYTEPEYDSAYFEPFINLPPRALKDYYRMIQEPISVRKLQRMVKGIHGRSNEATGISEFKTWAQFEDKAKLLWTNAYYYNEEGSEIYDLAQELEKHVTTQFKRAGAAVADPAPPKIKLKVGQQPTDQPTPSKKITIHVGSGRGTSTDALTPLTGESVGTPSVNGVNTAPTQTTGASAAASPGQSVPPGQKSEDAASTASPAVRPTSAASLTPAAQPPTPAPPVPPPAPVIPMEEKHPRRPGKGVEAALISSIRFFASHYATQSDRPVMVSVLPDPKKMQQSVTINVPPTHTRVGLITRLPEALQDRQYSLWTLLDKQPLQPNHQVHPGQHSSERIFELTLHPGLNIIESHLVAAIPKVERVPGESEVELEIFTIYVNVMRV